jgi:hypothetical protein
LEDQRIYIALVTKDFSLYQDLTKELREKGLAFVTLSPEEIIPSDVGVVITSPREVAHIQFPKVVIASDIETTVNEALRLLNGRARYERVVVGIDPGQEPGIAVIVDGIVAAVYRVPMDQVADVVERIRQTYPSVLVKIGNGARLMRTQIVNNLVARGAQVELVDESGTSPHLGRGTAGTVISDIVAAVNIALIEGTRVGYQYVSPSKGEIRMIQERSRELSRGRTTIPRKLAERIAKGKMSIEEALFEHIRENGEQDKNDI